MLDAVSPDPLERVIGARKQEGSHFSMQHEIHHSLQASGREWIIFLSLRASERAWEAPLLACRDRPSSPDYLNLMVYGSLFIPRHAGYDTTTMQTERGSKEEHDWVKRLHCMATLDQTTTKSNLKMVYNPGPLKMYLPFSFRFLSTTIY